MTRAAALILAAVLSTVPAIAAAEPAAAQPMPHPVLETHPIAVLVTGPNAKPGEHMPEALLREHLAYIVGLVANGTIVGGPISNPADRTWAGMSVFRSATPEDARAIAEADPSVKAGWFRIEILEWRVESGALAFPRAASAKKR